MKMFQTADFVPFIFELENTWPFVPKSNFITTKPSLLAFIIRVYSIFNYAGRSNFKIALKLLPIHE